MDRRQVLIQDVATLIHEYYRVTGIRICRINQNWINGTAYVEDLDDPAHYPTTLDIECKI